MPAAERCDLEGSALAFNESSRNVPASIPSPFAPVVAVGGVDSVMGGEVGGRAGGGIEGGRLFGEAAGGC